MAVVDKVAGKHGTKAVAQAYLEYLYTDEGQEIAAKHFYRPRNADVAAKYASQFPKLSLVTVDEVFGGWKKAQANPLRRWRRCSTRSTSPGGEPGPAVYPYEGMTMRRTSRSVLPGFGLSLGITCTYLSLMVLLPLATVFTRSADLSWAEFWGTITQSPGAGLLPGHLRRLVRRGAGQHRVRAAGGLGAGALSLSRPALVDAMVDLPFALPTAVAGIALTTLYAPNGWVGQYLEPLGIKVSYTWLGITVALIFIGLPFVVRTVQPVLDDLEVEVEEAAASLGAGRWQTFRPRGPSRPWPRRCSPDSRWPLPARSASTARWSSSRATCR